MTRPRAGDVFAGLIQPTRRVGDYAQRSRKTVIVDGALLLPQRALPEPEPGDEAIDTLAEQAEYYYEARRETWD